MSSKSLLKTATNTSSKREISIEWEFQHYQPYKHSDSINTLTNSLTNSMEHIHSSDANSQLIKIFSAFQGTRRFIIMFTRFRQ